MSFFDGFFRYRGVRSHFQVACERRRKLQIKFVSVHMQFGVRVVFLHVPLMGNESGIDRAGAAHTVFRAGVNLTGHLRWSIVWTVPVAHV